MVSQVDELSAPSDDVIQFRLKRPFRLLADLLAKPTPYASAIMPERLALAAPAQQVTVFGWPSMPRVEEPRTAWIDELDLEAQKRLYRDILLYQPPMTSTRPP